MRHFPFLAAALVIASCQGQEGAKDTAGATGNAIKAAAGKPDKQNVVPASDGIQPGEWESRIDSIHVEFEPVETPQGRLALDDTNPTPPPPYKLCVTEEKSKQLFKQYRTGGAAGESCSQASFTMNEGRIHGMLVCTIQGRESERQLAGRYTPTSYKATEVNKTRMTTPPGGEIAPTSVPMTITRKMTARRIGDCPGGQATG